jgi:hypothetical protein
MRSVSTATMCICYCLVNAYFDETTTKMLGISHHHCTSLHPPLSYTVVTVGEIWWWIFNWVVHHVMDLLKRYAWHCPWGCHLMKYLPITHFSASPVSSTIVTVGETEKYLMSYSRVSRWWQRYSTAAVSQSDRLQHVQVAVNQSDWLKAATC